MRIPVIRLFIRHIYQIQINRSFIVSACIKQSKKGDSEIPKNLLENVHSASTQPENGIVYDKKPFKFKCYPDKTYSWCLCGHSKNQPFCDGSHKNPYVPIKQRPVRFKVAEEKDYWLCNCKQTSHRPFCDGTHKREDIQSKIK